MIVIKAMLCLERGAPVPLKDVPVGLMVYKGRLAVKTANAVVFLEGDSPFLALPEDVCAPVKITGWKQP